MAEAKYVCIPVKHKSNRKKLMNQLCEPDKSGRKIIAVVIHVRSDESTLGWSYVEEIEIESSHTKLPLEWLARNISRGVDEMIAHIELYPEKFKTLTTSGKRDKPLKRGKKR